MRRYEGWGHTVRRLRWLFARAPKDCPVCHEPCYGWHGNVWLPPGLLTVSRRCSYCGQKLPGADAELLA